MLNATFMGTTENSYRIRTKGNEKGIKMFPHKKINSIQKTVMQKMKDKTRYKAYRKQWENDGIKFLFINHFKCK